MICKFKLKIKCGNSRAMMFILTMLSVKRNRYSYKKRYKENEDFLELKYLKIYYY